MAMSRDMRHEITDNAYPSGIRIASGGDPTGTDTSPLAGLLFCAPCRRQMIPMTRLDGRTYGAPCGCRLSPVDARTVDQAVFDAVAARFPDLLRRAGTGTVTETLRQVLTEVRIGGTADELELIWST
ncbi:zinc ribbon domain-containing protein [Solwaraspora sp. WMMB335]|uniref:zinc ribbon domain-containing protein n=1 Tax=Solwaraspora sp. WMMB335 TaxID=3404118 RepID=UPI003B95A911